MLSKTSKQKMKSLRSVLAKTEIYYSGSFEICTIIVYEVACWPIRCLGKDDKAK